MLTCKALWLAVSPGLRIGPADFLQVINYCNTRTQAASPCCGWRFRPEARSHSSPCGKVPVCGFCLARRPAQPPAAPTAHGQGCRFLSRQDGGGPALVSDILTRPGSAGEVTIDVVTTKSAMFQVFQLKAPARLVVDLEGMRNAVPRKSIPVSSPVVKDVRVGQFREKNPEVVRVVADLVGRSSV